MTPVERVACSAAAALAQSGLVAAFSLAAHLPHVWPGCLLVAGLGFLTMFALLRGRRA